MTRSGGVAGRVALAEAIHIFSIIESAQRRPIFILTLLVQWSWTPAKSFPILLGVLDACVPCHMQWFLPSSLTSLLSLEVNTVILKIFNLLSATYIII